MYNITITSSKRNVRYPLGVDTCKDAIRSAIDTIEKVFTEEEKHHIIVSCIKDRPNKPEPVCD